MTSSNKRGIPFGPQFSPEQTPLPRLLEVLAQNSGDYERLRQAIESAFFSKGSATPYNRAKKADNTTLALRDYGLLEGDKATLSPLGHRLTDLRNSPEQLYFEFGRHILLKLNGLAYVRTVQDLLAAGREVSLTTIPKALRLRGIHVPPTATHLSALKGWLKLAGVFEGSKTSYAVNETRLQELLGGLASGDLDKLANLNPIQRAFLRALVRFPTSQWSRSNDVAQLAETLYGVEFPWKSIAQSVLEACKDAGYVEYQKTTGGRGAKPHLVRPTGKFVTDVLEPLLAHYSDEVGSRLRDLLRTPLKTVIDELDHPSKNIKGKALELLALYLMFSLDLEFVAWRKRGKETAGAEVDVLVESARLMFSRWQVQCKNGKATLEDVAKEVGLAYHLNSNVVLVLSTRRVSSDALSFADSIMKKSNLQVIVLHEPHLRRIAVSPGQLAEVLTEHSRHAMQVKRLDPSEVKGTNANA
jgi:site-specific DNA-methyltransferase (cytosine-N4-specific)